MAKRSREQIKADEKKVMEELIEDSTQSPHQIAKKCGFSRQKAWRIIKRLEKENKIWGYTAVIEGEEINRNVYLALVKAYSPNVKSTNKLIKRIKNKKTEEEINIRLQGVYYLHGIYDWIVVFSAEDIKQAKRFIGYLEKHYSDQLEHVEMLESVFSLVKSGKENPDIEKIKKFSVD